MKSRKIKTEISEKLKNVCEELSEKERKGVLVGMLVPVPFYVVSP